MTRSPKLSPIDSGRHFGSTVTPLQQPVPPAAALAARRKSERLEAATRTTPICNSTTTGTYLGAELQPCTHRPGAMDAYTLPSITMGRRIDRRRPGNGN